MDVDGEAADGELEDPAETKRRNSLMDRLKGVFQDIYARVFAEHEPSWPCDPSKDLLDGSTVTSLELFLVNFKRQAVANLLERFRKTVKKGFRLFLPDVKLKQINKHVKHREQASSSS